MIRLLKLFDKYNNPLILFILRIIINIKLKFSKKLNFLSFQLLLILFDLMIKYRILSDIYSLNNTLTIQIPFESYIIIMSNSCLSKYNYNNILIKVDYGDRVNIIINVSEKGHEILQYGVFKDSSSIKIDYMDYKYTLFIDNIIMDMIKKIIKECKRDGRRRKKYMELSHSVIGIK